MSKTQSTSNADGAPSIVDEADVDPGEWLETSNISLIKARISLLDDREAVKAFVAYETRNQYRVGVLRWLKNRANELQES